jgi:hypothetical protein
MDNNNDHIGSGLVTPEDSTKTKKSKLATVLGLFIRPISLNRFEAESHHDHCLHSTVSSLEDYGVKIARRWETVPCLGGAATVRCKRYWLDTTADNIAFSRALLAALLLRSRGPL